MDSHIENALSGARFHHSFENAFEMELDAVPESEVRSAVENGVSVVSGELEPPSVEESFRGSRVSRHFTSDRRSIPLDGHR